MVKFQRADGTLHIVLMDIGGSLRIHGSQPSMQGMRAHFLGKNLKLPAEGRILRLLSKINAIEHGLDVKASAPNNDWDPPLGINFIHAGSGIFLETDHMEFFHRL